MLFLIFSNLTSYLSKVQLRLHVTVKVLKAVLVFNDAMMDAAIKTWQLPQYLAIDKIS